MWETIGSERDVQTGLATCMRASHSMGCCYARQATCLRDLLVDLCSVLAFCVRVLHCGQLHQAHAKTASAAGRTAGYGQPEALARAVVLLLKAEDEQECAMLSTPLRKLLQKAAFA